MNRELELLNNCFGYLTELISDEEELKRVLVNSIRINRRRNY